MLEGIISDVTAIIVANVAYGRDVVILLSPLQNPLFRGNNFDGKKIGECSCKSSEHDNKLVKNYDHNSAK